MYKINCKECNIKKDVNNYYYLRCHKRYDKICKDCHKIKNAKRILWHNFPCKIHGNVKQSKTLNTCKKCNIENKFKVVIKKLKLKNKNFDGFVDLKNPVNNNIKVKCRCKIHGIYTSTLNSIYRSKGTGCKKCGDLIRGKSVTKYNLNSRKCLKCNIVKSKDSFIIRKDKNNRHYLYQYCKECDYKERFNNCTSHKKRCELYGTKYVKFNRVQLVFKRDNYICQYCGVKCNTNKKEYQNNNYVTIDCIVPISKGGNYEPSNCVTACRQCNVRKSNSLNWKPQFNSYSSQLFLF